MQVTGRAAGEPIAAIAAFRTFDAQAAALPPEAAFDVSKLPLQIADRNLEGLPELLEVVSGLGEPAHESLSNRLVRRRRAIRSQGKAGDQVFFSSMRTSW